VDPPKSIETSNQINNMVGSGGLTLRGIGCHGRSASVSSVESQGSFLMSRMRVFLGGVFLLASIAFCPLLSSKMTDLDNVAGGQPMVMCNVYKDTQYPEMCSGTTYCSTILLIHYDWALFYSENAVVQQINYCPDWTDPYTQQLCGGSASHHQISENCVPNI